MQLKIAERQNTRYKYLSGSLIPSWVMAFILSYAVHESVVIGIMQGLLGWFYVMYWAISRTNLIPYLQQWVN